MSKFSKRAKFLSILAAASAVGKAGAGATTIPGYIPPSNANRNNLQVVKGPRFSIESAAVGATGATALGVAGLLVKNLFFNERRDAVNLSIELLKSNKVNSLGFNIGNAMTSFNFYGSDSLFVENSEKINKIKNPEERDKVGALMLRKFRMGKSEIEFSLPTSASRVDVTVYAGKDGKIHVDGFGGNFAADGFEQHVNEMKEKYKDTAKDFEKDAEAIRGVLNSRLVKEVLGEALKNKNYYDPSGILAKQISGLGLDSNPSDMSNINPKGDQDGGSGNLKNLSDD